MITESKVPCPYNLGTIDSQKASYPVLGFRFLPASLIVASITAVGTMVFSES